MPDTTYKTFLSPGSCQLEVTDLVASANDDKGVDLYGVAWEIEQVIMAGEGFAASPTDVWVNERGILNVGQSLFDKINRTSEDNTNIPGQCTVVVKATSLVDSSKVARLKVLVGYPSEGGGGGGGGVTLGTISGVVADDITVAVGGEFTGGAAILEIVVDDQTVTDSTDQLNVGRLSRCAAGASVNAVYHSVSEEETIYSVVFRWCTIDIEEYKYSSISEPINLAATTSTRTFETPFGTETWNVATFIMPEPPTNINNAYLLLSGQPEVTP